MSQSLGTPIIIDNKAEASGSIAAMEVARAAPGGYTLMQCFVATHSTNPAVLKLKYDPIADFSPVGRMAQTSNVLAVGEKNKAKNLQEFLAQARAKPGSGVKSCRSIDLHSTTRWPLISSGGRGRRLNVHRRHLESLRGLPHVVSALLCQPQARFATTRHA
jgi:hypothetical protein